MSKAFEKAFKISSKGVARYVLHSASLPQMVREELLEAVQTACREKTKSLLIVVATDPPDFLLEKLCPPEKTISETIRGKISFHYDVLHDPVHLICIVLKCTALRP